VVDVDDAPATVAEVELELLGRRGFSRFVVSFSSAVAVARLVEAGRVYSAIAR
jgi:hypothetical protein